MEKIVAQLTILFEDPFWIGVLEKEINGKYQVCKVTFGPEPKDYQVYEFMAKTWNRLEFSPLIHAKSMNKTKVNPKRLQRSIAKELKQTGVSTKAQQSISLQREEKNWNQKPFLKRRGRPTKNTNSNCGVKKSKQNTVGISPRCVSIKMNNAHTKKVKQVLKGCENA